MKTIFNASAIEQQVQIHGSWFTFKPKQVKSMDEAKAFFLITNRSYLGFVEVPEEALDSAWRSGEGKEQMKEAEHRGVDNRVRHLQYLKNNELASLAKDLASKNDKSDPRLYISDKMVDQIKELAQYKTKTEQEKIEKLDKIKELEALIGE